MGLNKELIITLQQLKGIGTKTILNIADDTTDEVKSIQDLCAYWKTLSGKKYEKISLDDLYSAHRLAKDIINRSIDNNIGIITYYEPQFPQSLKECIDGNGKISPAIVLYYRGDLGVLKKPSIAVIGTREPTPNGVKAGIHFSEEFAKRGFNIVSGLAIGCDTAGHRGALNVGGTTTTFLANGLDWDSIYPKSNLNLAKEIVDKGGILLSEYPMGESVNRYGLVARDRLQAGLSSATIAIQTGIKGGTMHAVNATIKANKPLFMVRYKHSEDIISDKVQGNIKLLQEGTAKPLGADTLEESIAIVKKFINTTNKPSEPIQTSLF